MDTVFGIPAHPLIVHVPVVLIPLTLMAAIAAVAWRRGRRALSAAALVGALVSFVGAQLATMSGERLEERVDATSAIHQHAQLGEATRTLAFVMLLAAAAYCAREWAGATRLPGAERVRALLAPRAVGAVLAVVLVTSALLATTWDVRTGHRGAEAVWTDSPALTGAHVEGAAAR